jgi:hypothetical protein
VIFCEDELVAFFFYDLLYTLLPSTSLGVGLLKAAATMPPGLENESLGN